MRTMLVTVLALAGAIETSDQAMAVLVTAKVTEITDTRDKQVSPPASPLSDGDNSTQWCTQIGRMPPEIQPVFHLDLGADCYVDQISFWNYSDVHQNKVSGMTVRFATDAEGVGKFGTTIPDRHFKALQFLGHSTEQKLSLRGGFLFRYAKVRLTAGQEHGNRIGFADIQSNVQPRIVTLGKSAGSLVVKEQEETSGHFTVALARQPSHAVTVTLDPETGDVGLEFKSAGEPHNLVFDMSNWKIPQMVVVRAVDDTEAEGPEDARIVLRCASRDETFHNKPISPITAVVMDNDVAAITVNETGATTTVAEEGETSDTFTVALAMEPTREVMVCFSDESEPDEVLIDPGELIFTVDNWAAPQSVSVTAIDDNLPELTPLHQTTVRQTASSQDTHYEGLVEEVVVAVGKGMWNLSIVSIRPAAPSATFAPS